MPLNQGHRGEFIRNSPAHISGIFPAVVFAAPVAVQGPHVGVR